MDMSGAMHNHPVSWLSWIASALLVMLIINGYILKFVARHRNQIRDKIKSIDMESNIHTFRVEGMTCSHCKATVENGLKKKLSIGEVLADPDLNRVTINALSVNDSSVQETVEDLGYSFKGRI